MKPNRVLQSALFLLLALSTLVTAAAAQPGVGRARQRPFSDWIDAQGTVLRPDGRPIVFAWADNPFTTLALTDYTGKLGAWVENHGGPAIGTTITGNVLERSLPDGTALVTVIEDFTNALAFAQDGRGIIFGYVAGELAGHPERTPALASGHLQLSFVIPEPGAPLQDIVLMPGMNRLAFRSNALGPMRAAAGVPLGTPGECIISQTALFDVPGGGAVGEDGYPAEVVKVHVLDGSSTAPAPAESATLQPARAAQSPSPAQTSWSRVKALYRNSSAPIAR